MQYANIIVNHKAGYEAFTYALLPEHLAYLAVGSVVSVPIGPQKVHGVVQQFVRRLDATLAQKLKPIASVVYPGAFVPEYVLQAAEDLHRRFGYNLGQTLFSFLPELPKRKQNEVTYALVSGSGYKPYEPLLGLDIRAQAYMSLLKTRLQPKGQSLLVLCQSNTAVENLANQFQKAKLPVLVCPPSSQIKARREYYLKALQSTAPTLFIGTRGALITPLVQVGLVVVDEPWLPGHKEANTPKLWTAFAAQSLCKARGIPLYLDSVISWPETRLIDSPRPYKHTTKPWADFQIVPKRRIPELLASFLGQYEETKAKLAVIVRESSSEVSWCSRCKKVRPMARNCPVCHAELVILPPITKQSVATEITQHETVASVRVLGFEEIEQFEHFDGILALNFDVFLSIVDFRSSCYLTTLLGLLRTQANQVFLATNHPDDWAPLSRKDAETFLADELATRRTYHLPPFALAVQLASKQKDILAKLTPLELDSVIKMSKIRKQHDEYVLSLLLKPNAKIPEEWHKKQFLKVDILPNYVE